MVLQSITIVMITITLMLLTHAGRRLLVAQLENLSLLALKTRRRMEPSATTSVMMDTLVWAPSAGRTAPRIKHSVTMVLTATSPMPTEEVQVRFTTVDQTVRNGETSGTSSATQVSIMSDAAYALLTALRV